MVSIDIEPWRSGDSRLKKAEEPEESLGPLKFEVTVRSVQSDSEERASTVRSAPTSRTVEVAVAAFDQVAIRAVAVARATSERVQHCLNALRRESEDYAETLRATEGSRPIKVSVTALEHPGQGK